ncbi:MAG: hypothetical protein GY775_19855 [Candidatus Scalindua sp.]|nr:hypothetical protein [Candidatus Scalindua sp.]
MGSKHLLKICKAQRVSESSYRLWCNKPESLHSEEMKRLCARIRELFVEHRKMAGSPMIWADLVSDPEWASVGVNNRRRKHSTNGYIAPVMFEELFYRKRKLA